MTGRTEFELKPLDGGAVAWGEGADGVKWAVVEYEEFFEVFGEHPWFKPGRYSRADGSLIYLFPDETAVS